MTSPNPVSQDIYSRKNTGAHPTLAVRAMLSQRLISESQLTQWLVDAEYLYRISHINLGLKWEVMERETGVYQLGREKVAQQQVRKQRSQGGTRRASKCLALGNRISLGQDSHDQTRLLSSCDLSN